MKSFAIIALFLSAAIATPVAQAPSDEFEVPLCPSGVLYQTPGATTMMTVALGALTAVPVC
jgi:hypothetical protein